MNNLINLMIKYPTLKVCFEIYLLAVKKHYKKVAKQYFIAIDNILTMFTYDMKIITPECMCDIRKHLIAYARVFKMNIP